MIGSLFSVGKFHQLLPGKCNPFRTTTCCQSDLYFQLPFLADNRPPIYRRKAARGKFGKFAGDGYPNVI
jgi:hypothetical protein